MLRSHFRPEFLNRIDEIVVFHPLSREHIRRIVDVQLDSGLPSGLKNGGSPLT
jgi:ATP-dependent Clp protease ATP-binding subunit ClpA